MDEGSWTDHGATGISSSSSKSYNAIDANLFNDDGTYYLTFGSFWQDIFQAPLNSAATKTASSSYNIAFDPNGDHAVEGAYLYKSGDYYYLFYSAGACCGYDTSRPATGDEYKIKVCRSSSATGDFVCGPAISLKHKLTNFRLMQLELPARQVEGQSFLRVMATSMDLADSMFLALVPVQ